MTFKDPMTVTELIFVDDVATINATREGIQRTARILYSNNNNNNNNILHLTR